MKEKDFDPSRGSSIKKKKNSSETISGQLSQAFTITRRQNNKCFQFISLKKEV